jgi:hypothetical protein
VRPVSLTTKCLHGRYKPQHPVKKGERANTGRGGGTKRGDKGGPTSQSDDADSVYTVSTLSSTSSLVVPPPLIPLLT